MSYAKALPALLAVLLAGCMMEPDIITREVPGPAVSESFEQPTEEIGESSSAAGDTCEWWRYIDLPWPR